MERSGTEQNRKERNSNGTRMELQRNATGSGAHLPEVFRNGISVNLRASQCVMPAFNHPVSIYFVFNLAGLTKPTDPLPYPSAPRSAPWSRKGDSLRSSRFLSFSKRSRTGGKLRESAKISSRGRRLEDGNAHSPPPHFSPIFCSPQACSFARPLFAPAGGGGGGTPLYGLDRYVQP